MSTQTPTTQQSKGALALGVTLGVLAVISISLMPALSGADTRRMPTAGLSQRGEDEDHPIEKRMKTCLDKAKSTADMIACADKAGKEWDTELNSLYQRLLKALPAKGQAELKESQKAWIVFRDREYKVQQTLYSTRQGTMYLPMAALSAVNLTKDRALQLDNLLGVYEIEKNIDKGN